MSSIHLLCFLLAAVACTPPGDATRCFLQPNLGGVPNENSSPLLCALLQKSQEEGDSEATILGGSSASEAASLSSEEERDALLRSLRQEGQQHNFMRFGRDPEHKFMRFGRDPEHKFMRFGRDPEHKFMRFGRASSSARRQEVTTLPLFMRLGRGPEHVFMRFGRYPNKQEAATDNSAEKGIKRK